MIAESLVTRDFDLALDSFLWQYAEAKGMQMRGLESAKRQFEIMDLIPLKTQLSGLKSTVKNVKVFKKKTFKMFDYYKFGKLKKLYQASKKSMGELRKLMIYDRNKKMTDALIGLMDEGSTFCSVGAAHLGGGKGMIRLLKKNGYKVKPLQYTLE